MACGRQGLRQGDGPLLHRAHGRRAVEYDSGCGHGGEFGGCRGLPSGDGHVVDEGVGRRLQRGPERRSAHLHDDVSGDADGFGLEQLHRVTPAVGVDELGDPVREVRSNLLRVVAHDWRLVKRQLADGRTVCGRLQRQHGAGGVPEHHRRAACLGDQRFEVLDLALDGVRQGVATVAPAAAVVGDHGEPRFELLGQGRAGEAVVERAGDEDDRRAVAGAVISDPGAVGGCRRVHVVCLRWLRLF